MIMPSVSAIAERLPLDRVCGVRWNDRAELVAREWMARWSSAMILLAFIGSGAALAAGPDQGAVSGPPSCLCLRASREQDNRHREAADQQRKPDR